VLLGALLGSGWAASQPTLYEGVARVVLTAGSDTTSLPGEAPQPPGEPEGYLRSQAQLMGSSPVLEGAVKLSRSRISVQTLRQRLEVDVAKDADVLTIRVLDSTATGAAQLANAIPAAYEQVVARRSREVAAQLLRARSALKTRLAEAGASLPGTQTTTASGRSVGPSQVRIGRSKGNSWCSNAAVRCWRGNAPPCPSSPSHRTLVARW
jgi:uncharacterized protein involved in exopolysaccharide biosynthesis